MLVRARVLLLMDLANPKSHSLTVPFWQIRIFWGFFLNFGFYLHISVDDPIRVEVMQRRDELYRYLSNLIFWERLIVLQDLKKLSLRILQITKKITSKTKMMSLSVSNVSSIWITFLCFSVFMMSISCFKFWRSLAFFLLLSIFLILLFCDILESHYLPCFSSSSFEYGSEGAFSNFLKSLVVLHFLRKSLKFGLP